MRDDRVPMVRAYLWWCGDEVCDCTQYRIERLTPRPWPSRFYDIQLLWESEFWTDGTGEYGGHSRSDNAERLRQFRTAAIQNGLRLRRDEFGHWAAYAIDAPDRAAAQALDEALG